MEGQHQQWGCVGDAISRNNRSIIIRLNTRGSMAQGLSKIGGCSACGGSTPCPKMPCQGSKHLWPDTPASIKLSFTSFNIFYPKLLEGSNANFKSQLFSNQFVFLCFFRISCMNLYQYQDWLFWWRKWFTTWRRIPSWLLKGGWRKCKGPNR